MTVKLSALRRLLHSLRFTLLHPQFLAFRLERYRYRKAAGCCSGKVLDIGSGRQPLRILLGAEIDYISLDHPQTATWYEAKPAVYADASILPFLDQSFDTVVCLEVLEHLRHPATALREAARVLRPEGRLIVSTPFMYPIHDAPMDFRRWTEYGIRELAGSVGMDAEILQPLGSPVETATLQFNLGWLVQAVNAPFIVALPMFALSLILVPVMNLIGLMSGLLPRTRQGTPMAIGYMWVLRRSSMSPITKPVE